MRFTYRKIETALDRVSCSQKSSGSKRSYIRTPNLKVDMTSLFWAFTWLLAGVMAIGFSTKYFEVKNPESFEKVRVAYHEEPIEKHVWLDDKLVEFKTISW